jgi:hypothetical protein
LQYNPRLRPGFFLWCSRLALSKVSLNEGVYVPLLDLLADHRARTLGEMEAALKGASVTFPQVLQAVMVLAGAGHLVPVQADEAISAAAATSASANTWLMARARGSAEISYLASPVTGGGFNVNRFQQLFLLSLSQGKKQPAEWAQAVWQTIAAQGQKLVKEGKTLETAEENLAELTQQAQVFAEKQLPILKALQIA